MYDIHSATFHILTLLKDGVYNSYKNFSNNLELDLFLMKTISLVFLLYIALFTGCSSVETIKEEEKTEQKSDGTKQRIALDFFIKGNGLEAKGDYAGAVLEYQEALNYDKSSGIYYSLAKCYLYLNKLSNALINIRNAVELEPASIDCLDLMQEIYTAARKNDSAIVILNKIIELDSANYNAYYKLGRLYETTNNPLRAIETYNKLLKQIGNEWSVLARLAELYEKMGNYKDASLTVQKLIELDPANLQLQKILIDLYLRYDNVDNALSLLDELLQFYPSDIDLREKKAQIYLQKDDWISASKEYEYLVKSDEISLDGKLRISTTYFSEALKDTNLLKIALSFFELMYADSANWQTGSFLGALYLLNDNDKGISLIEEAIEESPFIPMTWIQLSGILFDNKYYKVSAEISKSALKKFPEDFTLALIAGLSYAQNSIHDSAEIYLSKAVELNPTDITALSSYGYTLSQLKKSEEAIYYINKAIELDPNNIDLLGTLGLIYNSIERWEECDSVYTLALSKDPDNALINNNYAYSLSERGIRLDEALKMVNIALEEHPDNSSYLDTKGWIYFKMGEYTLAEEFIRRSLEIGGERAVIVDHLGDVLFKLGKVKDAIEYWKKAAELNPSDENIKLKIERGSI